MCMPTLVALAGTVTTQSPLDRPTGTSRTGSTTTGTVEPVATASLGKMQIQFID